MATTAMAGGIGTAQIGFGMTMYGMTQVTGLDVTNRKIMSINPELGLQKFGETKFSAAYSGSKLLPLSKSPLNSRREFWKCRPLSSTLAKAHFKI
jgi:hypothetical protein